MIDNFDAFSAEETPPKANAMINTFRAFGYNLQTAIADILDNSISAHAETIWINYAWDGSNSWVSILDDGKGMDRNELIEAMTPGSKDPNVEREKNDLGRFGLGLKTSSFSQCKILTVATKKENYALIKRTWDLDYVNTTGKWSLLDYISDNSFLDKLDKMPSGTLVLWQGLDRLVGESSRENEAARSVFLEEFAKVESHLSLVFHRYIDKKKVAIYINGARIESWDPFMKENGAQLLNSESLFDDSVLIKCYQLPHISSLSPETQDQARINEWYDLQGFYIYRNERLLLHGDWLGLFSKNELYKNARILIDIPNKYDHEWKIDIKKATATPPVAIRKDLIRLGKDARSNSSKVYRFRGNQIMMNSDTKSFGFDYVWNIRKNRADELDYKINTDHPVIKKIMDSSDICSKDIKIILDLVSKTLPAEVIIEHYCEDPQVFELKSVNKDPDDGMVKLAYMMFESLMISGVSADIARKQILHMQPFNEYPQLIENLK